MRVSAQVSEILSAQVRALPSGCDHVCITGSCLVLFFVLNVQRRLKRGGPSDPYFEPLAEFSLCKLI